MAELIEPVVAEVPAVEITPIDPQAAEPAPAEGGPELPDEILKIPAFGPLMAGSPPALSTNIKNLDKTEEGKAIAKNAKALQQSGIGFYRALSGDIGVIFNQLYVTGEAVKQADEAGQLMQLAPDFSTVNSEASKAGPINPVLSAGAPPEAPPIAPAPTPPQSASGRLPAPPASAETKLAGARAKNLQPGSPTSGPAPGRGRLLNNLLKPAI